MTTTVTKGEDPMGVWSVVKAEMDRASKMKPFTVILLYPDFLSDNYEQETYIAHVLASDPKDAAHAAQLQALEANREDPEDPDFGLDANDFFVMAVFNGHLEDLRS